MVANELDDQLDYEMLSPTESDVEGQSINSPVEESEIEELDDHDESKSENNTSTTSNKKARAKAKNKERKRIKNEAERNQKEHLALQEPAIIADYVAKLVTKTSPELSSIELQDRSIPEAQIVYTGNKVVDRKDIKAFKSFFEQYGLVKKTQPKKDLVLVLCLSAIRVCEVVRVLRNSTRGGALKLIKQNKPDYDKRCLRSPSQIAVSTPGRIFKLQELKILDAKRIKHVVVDTSILDSKQRTIWDIEGTVELVSELAHSNQAKVYLY